MKSYLNLDIYAPVLRKRRKKLSATNITFLQRVCLENNSDSLLSSGVVAVADIIVTNLIMTIRPNVPLKWLFYLEIKV